MSGRHGIPLRGLDATRSDLFQGRFGRMYRNLPPAQYGEKPDDCISNLGALAEIMHNNDPPKDGPDAEESGIPSLYTYFGQFIDHDITFDPVSSLDKQNDPDGLVDFRNPALNLDNVYGRGPDDQPYMYDGDTKKFLLGVPLTGGPDPNAFDLPRNSQGRALIGDPRNDENTIVSQLQGLFLRFHNRMADDNTNLHFDELQQFVRFHYQYAILNDFLPKIVSQTVLSQLQVDGRYAKEKLKYYHWRNDPFMPVEFSAAAYRLGHSMVRPGYRLNDNGEKPLPIFPPDDSDDGLTGFRPIGAGRAIDWSRFIDIDRRAYGTEAPATDADNAANAKRLQLAYRIDTSLVGPLAKLPKSVAGPPPMSVSLPERNLVRAYRLGLPSGQAVAHAMGLVPLTEDKIIIGQAVDEPPSTNTPLAERMPIFEGNCPLWTYVLAEAMQYKADLAINANGAPDSISTPQLGPVGGRIVAEVFLGLMFGDGQSMLSLHPLWTPSNSTFGLTPTEPFGLKHIVKYALGM